MGFFDKFFKVYLNQWQAFQISATLSVRIRDGEFSLREFIEKVELLLDQAYKSYPDYAVTPEQSRQIAGLAIYLSDHHEDFYKEVVRRRDHAQQNALAYKKRQERIEEQRMKERSTILSNRESELKKYLYQGFNIDEAVSAIILEDKRKSDPHQIKIDRYPPNYGPSNWNLPVNPMSLEERNKYLSKFEE